MRNEEGKVKLAGSRVREMFFRMPVTCSHHQCIPGRSPRGLRGDARGAQDNKAQQRGGILFKGPLPRERCVLFLRALKQNNSLVSSEQSISCPDNLYSDSVYPADPL